jgi:PAS domain S-box-containing protein
MSFIDWLFSRQDYMPHGMCFLWQPQLIGMHVISDTVITAAYYSMPVALIYFAFKRPDLVFRNLFLLSGLFILACGTTHAFNIWTLWHPDYRIDGILKAATALTSIATAIVMWRAMPLALALPGINALKQEIEVRHRTEQALRETNAHLEDRVKERTSELAKRNVELQNEISRHRSLIENSMDGIMLTRLDGRILAANSAASRMLGYSEDKLRLMNWRALITVGGADLHPLSALTVDKDNGRFRGEIQMRRANGAIVLAEISATKFPDTDGNMQAILILRDITERHMIEERQRQSQRVESVGQLAGGIAHDFNNLLTVVIGNLELVAEQGDDAAARAKLISSSLYAALRGAELTRRLLAYARQQPLNPQYISLNAMVTSMESMLRRTLGEAITIKTHLAPSLWPSLVDQGQLENALLNLTINARDSMPKGGTIVIETANTALDEDYAAHNADVEAGEYVLLSVSDEGTGMSEEVLAHAFEPYYTTKETGKGSGLGLSMVYGFVKQSGGHISIYSEQGQGTTVKLFLPRAILASTQAPQPHTPAAHAPRHVQGSILLVEDDAEVRDLGLRILRGLGLQVTEAADATEAISILSQQDVKFDLLFTDVVLPGGVHGPELADQALKLCPDLKILYTSGYTEDAIRQHGRLRGEVKLLSKPYRKEELTRRIFEMLER